MKPDWKDAPKWAKWLAQDYYGDWHWFRKKPHHSRDGNGIWCYDPRGYYMVFDSGDDCRGRGRDTIGRELKRFTPIQRYAGYEPPHEPYDEEWKNTLEPRPREQK